MLFVALQLGLGEEATISDTDGFKCYIATKRASAGQEHAMPLKDSSSEGYIYSQPWTFCQIIWRVESKNLTIFTASAFFSGWQATSLLPWTNCLFAPAFSSIWVSNSFHVMVFMTNCMNSFHVKPPWRQEYQCSRTLVWLMPVEPVMVCMMLN